MEERVPGPEVAKRRSWSAIAVWLQHGYAIEPAGFVMTRWMLLGLKERAEALRVQTSRAGESGGNHNAAA